MDINFEKGTITLFGKSSKFDTLIRKFAMLSGEQAYHFLVNRGIQLPRMMNCLALMSVLNRRIKFLNSNSLSKDYFTRLQYYSAFTEQQLFNLFVKICNDPDSFYAYRYNLFKLILTNFVAMDFSDGELTYVKNLKKASIESFEQYYNYISGAGLEQEDTFDGQKQDLVFKTLEFSASNQEIYDIAGKYGIEIPQSLKKEEFINYIVWYMMQNGTYNEEIYEGLNEMTVAQLDTYSERTGIPMSSTLSKKEIINYLIYLLSNGEFERTSVKRFIIPDEYKPFEFKVDLKAVSVFGNGKPKKVIHYAGEETDTEEFNQVLIKEEEEEAEALAIAEEEKLKEEEALKAKELEEAKVEETNSITDEADEIDAELDSLIDGENIEFVNAVYEDPNTQISEEEKQKKIDEAMASIPDKEETVEEVYETEEPLDDNQEVEYVSEEAPVILNEDLSDVEAASDEEIEELLKNNQEEIIEEKEEVIKDESFKFDNVIKNEDYGSDRIIKLQNSSTFKTVIVASMLALLVGVLIFIIIALVR